MSNISRYNFSNENAGIVYNRNNSKNNTLHNNGSNLVINSHNNSNAAPIIYNSGQTSKQCLPSSSKYPLQVSRHPLAPLATTNIPCRNPEESDVEMETNDLVSNETHPSTIISTTAPSFSSQLMPSIERGEETFSESLFHQNTHLNNYTSFRASPTVPAIDLSIPVGNHMEMEPNSSIVDIDKEDEGDIRCISEYSASIFSLLKQDEIKYFPISDFLSQHKHINASMRAILVDWLNEVAQEYRMKSETLYLAVNYTDRYLSLNGNIERGRLQLVGITCMLIASKYYETSPPPVDEFVYITDNAYSRDELLQMESIILNALEFNLTVVTINDFLARFLRASGVKNDKTLTFLASYLAELTLQEYKMLKYRPSKVAASASVIALYTCGHPYWNDSLRHYSNFEAYELYECMSDLLKLQKESFSKSSKLSAVYSKYSDKRYYSVSTITPPSCIPSMPTPFQPQNTNMQK